MNFQQLVDQQAKEQLDRFLQSKAALEKEAIARSAKVDPTVLDQMAQEITRKSFENENKPLMPAKIDSYTKFENTISPTAYVRLFEDQLSMSNIVDEASKMKFLPLMLQGKASYYADQLRSCSTWNEMVNKFEAEFKVDPDVIIAELRTMKTQNYNVEKYTDDFNNKISKLDTTTQGVSEHLKILYQEGLPWKIKDQLLRDRSNKGLDLSGLQAEAKRQQNVSTYIFKGQRWDTQDGGGGQPGRNDKGGQQGGRQTQAGQNQGGWNRRQQQQQHIQPYDIWTNVVFGPENLSGSEVQFSSLETIGIDTVVQEIKGLAAETSLDSNQKHLIVGVEQAIMDHIARQGGVDAGIQAGRSKIGARELLSEAERILYRSSGGLSLRDRLARDPQLREDVLTLLRDFEHASPEQEQLRPQVQSGAAPSQSRPGPRMRSQRDRLTDIPVQGMDVGMVMNAFSKEQVEAFVKYFGTHPDLMEGSKYFGNSEKQKFIMDITGTTHDIAGLQPIKANIPHINIVVGGYKVRAMVDSGSTTTMISTGLLDQMPQLKARMKPTSFTFMGVSEDRIKYSGMLYDVECQLAENLGCKVTMAVYENKGASMLVGNDMLGGPNSQLQVVAMNSGCSFYVLCDAQGHVGLVHYLKNIEGIGFPVEPKRIDLDNLTFKEFDECAQVGGLEYCVECAFECALNDDEMHRICCPKCEFPLLDDRIRLETLCSYCQSLYSCPEAVGNPLGDRILIKLDLLQRFDDVCARVGRCLVGRYSYEVENDLFELLVFAQEGMYFAKSDGLGCSRSMKFKVELIDPGGKPVCHDLRRYNQVKLKFIDEEVQNMKDLGVIEPYLGDWQSSVVVAPKPGPGQNLRFCVDLRDLNLLSKTIKYPFPTIEEIVHSLGDRAKVFTKYDLAKGYWQVAVELASQGYLAFVTRKGTWKFVRMPFGHKNAPAIFQAMMHNILDELLYTVCFVYIDDVIVFGKDEKECVENSRRVLELIYNDGLKCGGAKCEFLLRRVEVLGHIIENGKLYAKTNKLQGLQDLKPPTTRTEVRSLHGLLSFFRRFVRNFSVKCKPISEMMKEDVEIVWGDKQKKAMDRIVKDVVDCGLLLPMYGQEFIVTTDFSYNGIGGMLSQIVDGVEHPVMFCSRKLTDTEANYAPTEGEALAILFALRRFAYVLYGQKVVIRTDHRPLTFIQGGMEHNKKLARWWMALQEFDYRLEYLAGKSNLVADGLSRLTTNVEKVDECDSLGSSLPLVLSVQTECDSCEEATVVCALCGGKFCSKCKRCTDISLPFVYCDRCMEHLNEQEVTMNLDLLSVLVAQDGKDIISKIGVDKFFELEKQAERYEVVGGVLYRVFKDSVKEVPPVYQRHEILHDLHIAGAHVGIMKLYQMVRHQYWWLALFEDCIDLVQDCVACQAQKQKLGKLPLKPTHKFAAPFQCWALDYLPKLPTTEDGYNHLLICVDVFSKWVELVPMKTKNSSEVWQALYENIFSRFGVPYEFRTDRGREFYGLLTNKCDEYGVRLVRISVQHPNANGQAERYVAVVKRALKTVIHEFDWRVSDWKKCLPAVLVGLRFYQHRILGVSPFTVCCGLVPRVPVPQNVPSDQFYYVFEDTHTQEAYVDEVVEHMLWACKEIMGKLRVADQRAKQKHDAELGDRVIYEEGDLVLIKNRVDGSLASNLVGPFEFVRYKDFDRYSCILLDGEGREFDCSVQHLVPIKQRKRLRKK